MATRSCDWCFDIFLYSVIVWSALGDIRVRVGGLERGPGACGLEKMGAWPRQGRGHWGRGVLHHCVNEAGAHLVNDGLRAGIAKLEDRLDHG